MTRLSGATRRAWRRLWRRAAASTTARIRLWLCTGIRASAAVVAIVAVREVLEAGVLAEEGQVHFARGAVALLGDDDVGDTLARRVGFVHFLAVDHHDQVSVLLNRSRFTQVRHHRLLVLALLDAAVELRERDHRHAQFLRQRLDRARDLGDLGRAVFLVARHLHQLQVVDDDQAEAALLFAVTGETARAGTYFRRRERAAVVDVDRRRLHLRDRAVDAGPVFVAEVARAHVALVDATERRNHAERELLTRHFHREDRDRLVVGDRRVLGDVERERRLAHRRPARDDDEIARLQPGGHLVEFGVARAQ